MSARLRWVLLCIVLVLLSGCASGGRLVKASEGVRVFDLAFDTNLDWSRTTMSRVELWTIDGLPLNEFVVISKVKPNEHVFLAAKERKSRPDGPWFREGMRPDEIRDVLLDGLRGDGWTHVAASHLRPARFGDVDGLRFDLECTHANGLVYRGTYAAAVHQGRLTHWFWLAPAEHYSGRDIAAVNAMFDSARFVK
jgi:uncharacterized protein YceK